MDLKAKKILFNTYWSSQGWRDSRNVSTEDFEYAKSKGLMFDPFTISHDDCIKKIITLRQQISKEQICKAFLSSLSRRRLDLRSAVASYSVAHKLSLHEYMPIESGHFYENGKITHTVHTCRTCKEAQYGIIGDQYYENFDLSILNFERVKWGGTRHGNILYTYFDLSCFLKEHILEPNTEDCRIFRDILNIIETSNMGDYPSVLEKRLKDVLPSNKDERRILLEILACIGILEAKSYDRPLKGKSDWVYVTYWRGEDKFNANVVDRYFNVYLNRI